MILHEDFYLHKLLEEGIGSSELNFTKERDAEDSSLLTERSETFIKSTHLYAELAPLPPRRKFASPSLI